MFPILYSEITCVDLYYFCCSKVFFYYYYAILLSEIKLLLTYYFARISMHYYCKRALYYLRLCQVYWKIKWYIALMVAPWNWRTFFHLMVMSFPFMSYRIEIPIKATVSACVLTHFWPMLPLDTPWKHQNGALRVIKGEYCQKWVKGIWLSGS